MIVERCEECGFDAAQWTDSEALAAVRDLPRRWVSAIDGLGDGDLMRRPIAEMWSIAEYTNHVREVTYGMRFVLNIARSSPGTDLGEPPEAPFQESPSDIDVSWAVSAFQAEVEQLCDAVEALPVGAWSASCLIGANEVDAHWIIRHALHDTTHHLGDINVLRAALRNPRSGA